MAEFPSPVSLADFQYYMKDVSTDTTYKAFLQGLLDAATSRVYNYLRRDYTPSAVHVDYFWGNDDNRHQFRFPLGATLTAITERSFDGSSLTLVNADFFTGPNGTLISAKQNFRSDRMYAITYTLSSANLCPDVVMLVIKEFAYRAFEEGRRGLGSLGKGTDYSNVLGQSSLRFVDLTPLEYAKLAPFIYYGG